MSSSGRLPCQCQQPHALKRIVVTGGPGAGKTAVLELLRLELCQHMLILPEAASILFTGGFPRGASVGERAAAQRAIYYVERELEASADASDHPALVLCDRGTVDGMAYWPGPGSLWDAVHTSREDELARYDIVIHLRTPDVTNYNHLNPVRTETAAEAAFIDQRIIDAWRGHPRRFFVESTSQFFEKAQRAVSLIRAQLPDCCGGDRSLAQLSLHTL